MALAAAAAIDPNPAPRSLLLPKPFLLTIPLSTSPTVDTTLPLHYHHTTVSPFHYRPTPTVSPHPQVFDNKKDGPRFVFHTAFEDPLEPPNAPSRRSIEIRAIAFFDAPPLEAA